MTKAERECVVRFDDEERVASWYSCFPKHWRMCEAKGWRLVSEQRSSGGRVLSREYAAPVSQLVLRSVSAETVEKRRRQGVEVGRRNLHHLEALRKRASSS